MFFVIVFFAIVAWGDFFAGLLLDFWESTGSDKSFELDLFNRVAQSLGITALLMVAAYLVSGLEGVFNAGTESAFALPLLVLGSVVGAFVKALPKMEPNDEWLIVIGDMDLQHVVRQTVVGAVARQAAMGVLVLLFFAAVIGLSIMFGGISAT